nr:GNAT family acetyltransferase [Cellulomonas sp. PhB143]
MRGAQDQVVLGEIADDDVAAVVALWQECGLTRPWNDPDVDVADARRNPTSTVLVARRDGAVVGTAMAGYDGHRGWVSYVAVAPATRTTGIGRALVRAAEQWLAGVGATKVQLMVRSTNGAVQGFYARLGYTDQETVVLGRWLDGRR